MISPITAEIIREYFETVAEEIIETMVRASVSPIFNEAHDCSAGVFYYDGKQVGLVARGDAVPVHIYACLTSVEACVRFFHGDLNEGDVLLACDPFFGGTHIGDYTIIKPVFQNNKPVFFTSVRAHMLDVGGPVPGGFNADAEEVWQEGFRFPPMKVFEKGEPRRDVWDLLRANNRLPDVAIADLNAMIGGCTIGEERIKAVIAKYGLATVREGVEYTFDYSEKKFRHELARWPKGVYRGHGVLDQDFRGNDDINVEVAIEVKEDEVVVDFSGSHGQSPGVINSVSGNTISYVYGCFSAVCPDIPINSGFFRPIRVRLPEGSVVNPRPPAAAAYATICIGCTIGEAVMQALEQFVPERVGTTSIDLCILWTHGTDPRTRRFFISYDYHASPVSSGGAYGVDGWGGWSALFCALKLASVEMTEVQYPFLYLQGEYSTDSAAPGQWRGAPAYIMQRMAYQTTSPIYLNIWVQGARHTLQGYCGGRPGVGNYAVVHHGSDNARTVTDLAFLEPAEPQDLLFFQSGGGGGWGDPLSRDPAAVLADVRNEYVSFEGAEKDYGVIIDPASLTVDEAATRALRAERRGESGKRLGFILTQEREDAHYGRKTDN